MQNGRYVTLHSGTITANTTTATVLVGNGYTAVRIMLTAGTNTGTSPTLNTYIQGAMRLADGTDSWYDWISLTQLDTTDNPKVLAVATGSGEEIIAGTDGTLAAGQIVNGPIPSKLRAKFVVGGTNPSFGSAALVLELIP